MEEKRYYWLKLKRDFFKRHDIKVVESMQNGTDYLLFYLKLLCESIDHEGNLRFSEQIPYNAEMLSAITGTNVDIVRSAVKVFTELGMMELLDDGTIYMNEVESLIGSQANNDNANRQRRFRERQKQNLLPDRYASVTKSNERIEKEIEKEKEKELEEGIVKGRSAKRSPTPTPDPFDVEDEELKEALKDFEKMRKGIKAPLTDRAKKQILTKLNRLAPDTNGKIEVLNQSIVNCWKDVYELHKDDGYKPKQPSYEDNRPRNPDGTIDWAALARQGGAVFDDD